MSRQQEVYLIRRLEPATNLPRFAPLVMVTRLSGFSPNDRGEVADPPSFSSTWIAERWDSKSTYVAIVPACYGRHYLDVSKPLIL
jgi:hypothetical protein